MKRPITQRQTRSRGNTEPGRRGRRLTLGEGRPSNGSDGDVRFPCLNLIAGFARRSCSAHLSVSRLRPDVWPPAGVASGTSQESDQDSSCHDYENHDDDDDRDPGSDECVDKADDGRGGNRWDRSPELDQKSRPSDWKLVCRTGIDQERRHRRSVRPQSETDLNKTRTDAARPTSSRTVLSAMLQGRSPDAALGRLMERLLLGRPCVPALGRQSHRGRCQVRPPGPRSAGRLPGMPPLPLLPAAPPGERDVPGGERPHHQVRPPTFQ
jgi:hypothetical protein